MPVRRLLCALVLLQGCHSPPDLTDQLVVNLASQIRDVEPLAAPEQAPTPRTVEPRPEAPRASKADGEVTALPAWDHTPVSTTGQPKEQSRRELTVPPELPGSGYPPIRLPKDDPAREAALRKLYPALPALPPDPATVPGPEGRPLTLSELQQIAALHNPAIKNALAGVEAAKGAVKQAGAYPNPSLIYESDTVGTGGGGYQGVAGIDQPIKGANKLKLQQAMAVEDLHNAEVALRKAQSDLATQVRSNYFAVLVARENVRVSRAIARFTDEIYRVQTDLLGAGEAASYEPMQLRPVALQARFNLTQALNQYKASWLQLAAALGVPDMPCTDLAGRVDLPLPVFHYGDVLARVLSRHTDVLTAENSLKKARYALELAQVTPFPDFDVHVTVQKDYTAPPHYLVYSAGLTVPVPLWDQNKGAIQQAHGQLVQATVQPDQTRLQLTNTLADAFNRYVTNREQVEFTRQQVEDQVRVFPMLYRRYQTTVGELTYSDVITALQTLTGYISAYVTALGLQWTAVVDVANLLQTEDLFGVAPCEEVTPVPNLDELLPMPARVRPVSRAGPGVPQVMDQMSSTKGSGN